ncbi:SRPBCC family protein [Streptomyces sp. NPDC052811]|uniref:SRPBCC family protein n=1 Tax=Streptomyces sp. NPDC052811 TaxID=3155731 RepID=UPI00342C4612
MCTPPTRRPTNHSLTRASRTYRHPAALTGGFELYRAFDKDVRDTTAAPPRHLPNLLMTAQVNSTKEPLTMHRYDVTVTTKASPDIVWKLLVDAASWPLWSKVDSLDTARSTDLDPGGDDGVGAIRAFRTGRTVTGERLTEKVEHRLLAYEDAYNPSMRNYHARIELEPTPGSGTVIRWYGEYETSLLLRWIMPRYLQKFMRGMAEGLARYAEEHTPTP